MGSSSRRIAREYVLRVLYAYEMTKNPIRSILNDQLMGKLPDDHIRRFSESLVFHTIEHLPQLDQILQQKALNWDFSRIAILDKMIIRIGICELLFFEDIPPKVTINEAIEIAKKYSTSKSSNFVNGILDALLQELKQSGKLNKKGRGLLD